MASNIDLYSDRKVNAKKKENMGRLNGLLSLFSAVTLLISEKVHTVNKIIQAVTFLPNNCQSVKKSTEILVILHYKNMVPWPLGWPCVFLFFFFFRHRTEWKKNDASALSTHLRWMWESSTLHYCILTVGTLPHGQNAQIIATAVVWAAIIWQVG